MYKTIEDEVLKKAAPAELKAEFIQHDFERLRTFCQFIYAASIAVWVVFDLIISPCLQSAVRLRHRPRRAPAG